MNASLTDPLTLMREYTMNKKAITLDGEHIVFGRTRFPRKAKTAYKNTGAGEGFYQIDSVWSILQGKKTAEYVRWCGSQMIPVVHVKDRRPLEKYLKGGEADSSAIDYSQYVAVQPVSAEAAGDSSAVADSSSAAEPSSAAASSSKPLARPRELTAEEAKQLEEGRKAIKRLLVQPNGVPSSGDDAAAEAADAAAGEGEGDKAATKSTAGLKDAVALAKPFIRADREATMPIVRRERQLRTRSSILLAPSVQSLPVLTTVLEGFKKRNKAQLEMLDKEQRRAAKQADIAAGRIAPKAVPGVPPPPPGGAGPAAAGIPPLPAHLGGSKAPSSKAASGGGPAAGQPARPLRPVGGGGKLSGVAVIAVPAAITAIVNMYNAKELFESGGYDTGPECKAAGVAKEATISVRHTFDDGSYANILIMDNPTARLAPADWAQLCGVVVQGSTWQFKGWPFPQGEPELFAKCARRLRSAPPYTLPPLPPCPLSLSVTAATSASPGCAHRTCGITFRFSDEIPNQKTKGWAVKSLVFSREKSRRHEVNSVMTQFWDYLHKFIMLHKPHLLHKPVGGTKAGA